ncbi:MAG TPA: hypothetical protein VK943_10940 [Arenibaculum sp.]|nr:hypothetical protein [Arenibaculum sp.]
MTITSEPSGAIRDAAEEYTFNSRAILAFRPQRRFPGNFNGVQPRKPESGPSAIRQIRRAHPIISAYFRRALFIAGMLFVDLRHWKNYLDSYM